MEYMKQISIGSSQPATQPSVEAAHLSGGGSVLEGGGTPYTFQTEVV